MNILIANNILNYLFNTLVLIKRYVHFRPQQFFQSTFPHVQLTAFFVVWQFLIKLGGIIGVFVVWLIHFFRLVNCVGVGNIRMLGGIRNGVIVMLIVGILWRLR